MSLASYLVAGSDSQREAYTRFRQLLVKDSSARQSAARNLHVEERLRVEPGKGFRVLGQYPFPEVAEVIDAAKQQLEIGLAKGLQGKKDKRVITGLLPRDEVTADSPFMRLALREDLLNAASDYLGVVPVLAVADVWYSPNHPGAPMSSELYHCDWDDVRQFKVFIYCSDVDMPSGPMHVVPAAESATLRKIINYRFGGKKYRVDDAEVDRLVGPGKTANFAGKEGTVVFVDTSRCFHFGGRIQEGCPPRLLAMMQYLTPTAFGMPLDFRSAAPFRGLALPDHSPMQRMVLGAE